MRKKLIFFLGVVIIFTGICGVTVNLPNFLLDSSQQHMDCCDKDASTTVLNSNLVIAARIFFTAIDELKTPYLQEKRTSSHPNRYLSKTSLLTGTTIKRE